MTYLYIYLIFSRKAGFDNLANCLQWKLKLSKSVKNMKNIINLLSAAFFKKVLMVNTVCYYIYIYIYFTRFFSIFVFFIIFHRFFSCDVFHFNN